MDLPEDARQGLAGIILVDMKTTNVMFLSILLIVSLFSSGCTVRNSKNETIYKSNWSMPDVISFIRDYPNASTTVTEYSKENVSEKIDEWNSSCPNLTETEYKVLNVSFPPHSLSVWINSRTNDIDCSIRI